MGEDDLVGFRGPQVCKIVGITYRQLDYWARTDLIRPSIADARGSGTQRRYSYRDLVELKVIKGLLDAGVSLQSARRAIEYLRDHLGEDIATASLVINGTGSLLVRTDGELVDLIRRGQGVLSIVALGGVKDELDAAITDMPQAQGPSGPLSGKQGPSGPLSGTQGPSGPLSGKQDPSGPLSGKQGSVDRSSHPSQTSVAGAVGGGG